MQKNFRLWRCCHKIPKDGASKILKVEKFFRDKKEERLKKSFVSFSVVGLGCFLSWAFAPVPKERNEKINERIFNAGR